MSAKPVAELPISKDDLESLAKLAEVDYKLFRQTFNDFFIMAGLLPDVPTGMRPGMVRVNGIWVNGILYSQYWDWKDSIENYWGEFDTKNFGVIYGSKN